jgi:molybdopterin-guanine dinucleotide biosynthesis protein A
MGDPSLGGRRMRPLKPIPFAAVLAGGKARRMGTDKAILRLGGVPLIERVQARVSAVSERVVVIGGQPGLEIHGASAVPDRYPGADALGGIATALAYAASCDGPDAWVLCVACDMPFLEPRLLAHLASLMPAHDVVVPRVRAGHEPLCSLYRATCLPVFEAQIATRNLRIFDVYPKVRTRVVGEAELREFDPELVSFLNLNRPDDVRAAQAMLGRQQSLDSEDVGFL